MLILTRTPSEGIWIGDDVRVVVASVDGKKVRLAIDAPREIRVARDEVREREQRDDEK